MPSKRAIIFAVTIILVVLICVSVCGVLWSADIFGDDKTDITTIVDGSTVKTEPRELLNTKSVPFSTKSLPFSHRTIIFSAVFVITALISLTIVYTVHHFENTKNHPLILLFTFLAALLVALYTSTDPHQTALPDPTNLNLGVLPKHRFLASVDGLSAILRAVVNGAGLVGVGHLVKILSECRVVLRLFGVPRTVLSFMKWRLENTSGRVETVTRVAQFMFTLCYLLGDNIAFLSKNTLLSDSIDPNSVRFIVDWLSRLSIGYFVLEFGLQISKFWRSEKTPMESRRIAFRLLQLVLDTIIALHWSIPDGILPMAWINGMGLLSSIVAVSLLYTQLESDSTVPALPA